MRKKGDGKLKANELKAERLKYGVIVMVNILRGLWHSGRAEELVIRLSVTTRYMK